VSKDPKVKTAVRNLRQREDVAKYLRNLDPNSAPYDGKSRIMKENPNPDLPADQQTFKGDNFVKFSGDSLKVMQMEAFMIEANRALTKNGATPQPLGASTEAELNTLGMPSQIEILKKEHANRKTNLQKTNL